MRLQKGVVLDTTKERKLLVEKAKITYRRRNLTVWKIFYFYSQNLYFLMIDNKWAHGGFISRDQINEAYKRYESQGHTVEIEQKGIVKIKRRRG